MYADDTSLPFQSQDISQFKETVTDDLKRLDLRIKLNNPSILICTKPNHQKRRTAGGNLCLNITGKEPYLNHYTLAELNQIFAIASLCRDAMAQAHFRSCKNSKTELLGC